MVLEIARFQISPKDFAFFTKRDIINRQFLNCETGKYYFELYHKCNVRFSQHPLIFLFAVISLLLKQSFTATSKTLSTLHHL